MYNKILIVILITGFVYISPAYCQDSGVSTNQNTDRLLPKPFVDSVLFGTGAGILLGLVLGGGVPGLMRGASLGLYGGIILGWYVSSDHGHGGGSEVTDIPEKSSPSFHFSYNF